LELRRTVVLPPYCEGAEGTLRLGAWADIDETYINGINIGGRPNQYEPRDYRIPAGMLHTGANEIVVRLGCNAGSGRVT
ncbi:9-O-acetylesterase, partial [Bifidobacterium longum]|nr:9-O-acetylesterase [Bifidobacterium longum]